MSKNTSKIAYKSVLADSPEELAERMVAASKEVTEIVQSFVASDLLRMIAETRHLDKELQSKAGFKHLVRGVVKLAQEHPEELNLAVAKAMLWTEARIMSRRGAKGRLQAVQDVESTEEVEGEPMDVLSPQAREAVSILQALRPVHKMTQREIAFTGSRGEAMARKMLVDFGEKSTMTGPVLVDTFDAICAGQLAEITDRKDARVPLTDDSPHRGFLLDIRGALSKADLTSAVAMMLVMADSHMASVAQGGRELLEVIR